MRETFQSTPPLPARILPPKPEKYVKYLRVNSTLYTLYNTIRNTIQYLTFLLSIDRNDLHNDVNIWMAVIGSLAWAST